MHNDLPPGVSAAVHARNQVSLLSRRRRRRRILLTARRRRRRILLSARRRMLEVFPQNYTANPIASQTQILSLNSQSPNSRSPGLKATYSYFVT